MKILKITTYILAAFVLIWLLAAAIISGECKFEKATVINAPVDRVWQNTNSLKAMESWSPWQEKDPNAKKDWSGTTGQPGEQQCWQGNEAVGKGCIKVLKVDSAIKRIDIEMTFLTPYESKAMEYVTVHPNGPGSKAVWGFNSEIPFPFSPMKLFMDLEDQVGPDFTLGLQKLKALSEKP